MLIRRMEHSDLPEVADIESQSNRQPWTYDDFEESLTREDGTTLLIVAEDDADKGGVIAGYAVLYMAAGEGEIVTIAVSPGRRRQGVGRMLIEALPGFAADGAGVLFEINLEVRKSNAAAIALYRSCGFELVGSRPRFYSDPTEDALLMKEQL